MVINLDLWLQLDKWDTKTTAKGVKVIDRCLNPIIRMARSPKSKNSRPNKNITPRKKSVLPSKYKEFIVDTPSGYCPKCTYYVRDKGVVCPPPCAAWWHYECAGVTQDELDEKWSNTRYLCLKHRTNEEKRTI